MSAPLHVVRAGQGPRLLFVHGSATDHTAWSIQLASSRLREQFELIAYDRRATATSVEEHAEDAAAILDGEPAILAGSSFGSVIVIELMRTRPELVRGAVLIEPPMAASDELDAASAMFLDEFDRRVVEQGGPAAAEFFLRFVLGDRAFERMPQAFRDRATARWAAIRADSGALMAYKPRYRELAHVTVPTLLLGGGNSASYFRPTLDALAAVLPNVQLAIIPHAGHMLQAEAGRAYSDRLIEFAAGLPIK